MTRTCWSRTDKRTQNVAGKSYSLRSLACQQIEIRQERESIRVKPGATLGVLREGPHAQQSSNMSKETELTPEDVPVVREYVSIFPKDLPGLPPDREIMISIELMPGTTPILRALYQLVPTKLKELKD